jgi:hypothetical protein
VITSLTAAAVGGTTAVTAVSSLSAPVWYFWWANGVYYGGTQTNRLVLRPDAGESLTVECADNSTDATPSFTSACAPARRLIQWLRSTDAATASYLVEEQIGGGSWTKVAVVPAGATTWQYEFRTAPLTDLAAYAWRVTAQDAAGRGGTPLVIPAETIVRTPDPPAWAFSFDSGSGQVTFSAA